MAELLLIQHFLIISKTSGNFVPLFFQPDLLSSLESCRRLGSELGWNVPKKLGDVIFVRHILDPPQPARQVHLDFFSHWRILSLGLILLKL